MVNYVKVTTYRKTFQNKIFPELNSKKHTPSSTVWVLRNCGITQNSSCGIAQNLSFAKAEKGNFARSDFCEWLRKLLFFRAKLMRKERKILRFVPQKLRKSFANGNPIRNAFWILRIKVFNCHFASYYQGCTNVHSKLSYEKNQINGA